MKLVVLGLSLSSSWGNGHATTYRALLRAFAERGHDVLFLERDVPWYAAHRDCAAPEFCRLALYADLADLLRWRAEIARADAVIIGSYVPDGIAVADWVFDTARGLVTFYDIDTPVTLAALARGEETYLAKRQIPSYARYFSFTGGPTLDVLRDTYGSPAPVALYCSVDLSQYRPAECTARWDLSYLGTYSDDRQPKLERYLLEPARRAPHLHFVVAGPQYPASIAWPSNVERIEHVPPAEHPAFYSASRYTLNITRADMVAAGYSPSVRLFEAGACGTAIVSDDWEGLNTIFGENDIVIAHSAEDVLGALEADAPHRNALAASARTRITSAHSSTHRAAELERALKSKKNSLLQPRSSEKKSLLVLFFRKEHASVFFFLPLFTSPNETRTQPMKIEALALKHERWAKMFVATIRDDDGQVFERDIEDHGDAAAVLPYDPERRVALLIRQSRAPCLYVTGSAHIIELPAGRLDEDDPETCARREALEESGVALKRLDLVATAWSLPGLSTERTHLFLAEYAAADIVSAGGGLAEENENIAVLEIGLTDLAAMADRGEVQDQKALVLVQTLRLRRPDLFG